MSHSCLPSVLHYAAFEALIPMGLVGVMFFVTGTGFNALARFRNDGKVSSKEVLRFGRLDFSLGQK